MYLAQRGPKGEYGISLFTSNDISAATGLESEAPCISLGFANPGHYQKPKTGLEFVEITNSQILPKFNDGG